MAKKTLTKPDIEKDIRDLLKDLKENVYAQLRKEQETDQDYYDDNFSVSIKDPYHVRRTGTAARIVDSITDHISTSNPQAFREPRKKTEKEEERAAKVARLLNHWLPLLIDEIEESIKNNNLRGEAFLQIEYNENYDPKDDKSLPIIITAPDPMNIYSDPYEVNGVPRRVVKSCKMAVGQVEAMFPNWKNPEKRGAGDKEGVDYLAYWSKDWRYIEADKEPLTKGDIQSNVFNFVPLVHCYSGYGKRSPEGKPETKAVGRLRKVRGGLEEECETESRADSIIGLHANPVIVLKPTDANAEVPDEADIELSPGRVLILDYGWDYEIRQADPNIIVPILQHLNQIRQRLGLEVPPIAMGLPSTSRATGRQEDIYGEHFARKYAKLINNVERMWATALGMGLRILDTVPALLPITVRATVLEDGKPVRKEETITKEDIDGYYDCKVELRAEDELIHDRKVMLGRTLVNEGRIDWRTFLIEYVGYTENKAEDVINQTLADQAILTDPAIRGIITREVLEKLGMQRYLKELEAQAQRQQQMQQAMAQTSAPQGRPSEARNPAAAGITRQMLGETPYGARESSAGYTQGGGL